MSDTIIGGRPLSKAVPRYSFGLYGRFGAGKTLGAASFLAPGSKAIVFNVEFGPEDAAGGLTTLKHAEGILDIKQDDILLLDVKDWADMQNQFAWLCQNRMALVEQGYTLVILDSGTALSRILQNAFTDMAPEHGPNVKRHSLMGELVPTILGESTSLMELGLYPMVTHRYIEMHSQMKQLPFTFVTTFAEKDAYDEETRKIKIGIGPKLVGKELPSMIPGEVDGMFHCEQRANAAGELEYVWLTDNDPTVFGNDNMYVAKRRFGLKLDKYIPANGLELMRRIGAVEAA